MCVKSRNVNFPGAVNPLALSYCLMTTKPWWYLMEIVKEIGEDHHIKKKKKKMSVSQRTMLTCVGLAMRGLFAEDWNGVGTDENAAKSSTACTGKKT